jgi:tetratricopeptide (TPR) repeat protein
MATARFTLKSDPKTVLESPLEKFLLGRSDDCEIVIKDPHASRIQAQVRVENGKYYIENLGQNLILVNGVSTAGQFLNDGDVITIGITEVTFQWAQVEPTEPEAVAPAEETVAAIEHPRPTVGEIKIRAEDKIESFYKPINVFGIAAGIFVFFFLVYLSYQHIYRPLKLSGALTDVARNIEAGKFNSAREKLTNLLESGLQGEKHQRARELLSQLALSESKKLADEGRLEEARDYLSSHLRQFEGSGAPKKLLDQLDLIRLRIAAHQETKGNYQIALNQYSAVSEAGPHYDQAQKGIQRIWLKRQQQRLKEQDLDRLLKEAETHFLAKRYLTPVDNNAYSIYQTVLNIDPQNSVALARIEQMKSFYKKAAERHFVKKNWKKALLYFERYNFIAPQNPDVLKKMDICRERLATSQTGAIPGKKSKTASGQTTQSSRKMKFLIDTQGG